MCMTSWFKDIVPCNISKEAISTQADVKGHVFFFFAPTFLHQLLVWLAALRSLPDADMRFNGNYLEHKSWKNG